MEVRVETEPFDPGAEHNRFLANTAGAGAAVSFTGLVRSGPDDAVSTLTLECYVDLARAQIGKILKEAMSRFGLIDAEIIHRFGRLEPA
jgi:molybdopterin synthase catalytic subunit